MTDQDSPLSEENAQKVLARALELQAQRAGALTVAQIHEIASELSIPETAVNQAITEYRAASAAGLAPLSGTADVPATRGRRQSARPVVMTLAIVGGAMVILMLLFFIMRLFPPT
jgi:hypothetical protein